MFESREKNGNKKRVYRPFFIPLLLILLTGSCGSTDAADTATDHETVDLTADTKADDKTELLIYPPSGCYEEGTEITVSIKDGKIVLKGISQGEKVVVDFQVSGRQNYAMGVEVSGNQE